MTNNELFEHFEELEQETDVFELIDELCEDVFIANMDKGFWDDAFFHNLTINDEDFDPERRNFGELLMLIVSELGEAVEAHRKGWKDDHLPDEEGRWVECADAVIRLFDLAGAHGVNLGSLMKKKLEYNRSRPYKHGKKY